MTAVFTTLKTYPSLVALASSSRFNLWLGSGSFTRKLILNQNGFTFQVIKANIDERALGDRTSETGAVDLVKLLANAKADAIMSTFQPTNADDDKQNILLTADQVVTSKGRILEKPLDEAEARHYISLYNNGQCSTVGSIALTDLKSGRRVIGVDSATIYFKEIPSDVIDQIVTEGEAVNCAGGLMVEHPLLQPFIDRIDGTVDSVMGLSCPLLERLFSELLQN